LSRGVLPGRAKVQPIPKSRYNTNLAAEFFILSMLHRRGLDSTITLGNKKAVDIVVAQRTGKAITIDVKGSGW